MKVLVVKAILALGFCLTQFQGIGQNGLTKGDAVENLPIKKVLNSSSALTSLSGLEGKVIFVDFFGTWCIPCLRALPHLTEIKEKYRSDVSIVLVSNDTEAQLTKFLKARDGFSFPVIVDEDNRWNELFQPPSLPYTVVVKGGKVLAITEPNAITNNAVQQWLNETDVLVQVKKKEVDNSQETTMINRKSSNAVVQLSQSYIYAAKTDDSSTTSTQDLARLTFEALQTTLTSNNAKKAFWINLYNGYTQTTLKSNPEQYKSRSAFFKKKSIEIAGKMFSLDDIEHGILRRSKIKWSLGYLSKLFPSKIEKELRVDKLDYRIHFALNCGAKSCPPIAFYNDEILGAQLNLATKAYLSGEAEYDSVTNSIRLPKLMSWFRADFGGKKGMIRLLRQYKIIPAGASPTIRFKDYDWTLTLNNYTKQNS